MRARDTKSKQEFALKQIVTQSTEAHKLAKDELALMQVRLQAGGLSTMPAPTNPRSD